MDYGRSPDGLGPFKSPADYEFETELQGEPPRRPTRELSRDRLAVRRGRRPLRLAVGQGDSPAREGPLNVGQPGIIPHGRGSRVILWKIEPLDRGHRDSDSCAGGSGRYRGDFP
jgi:hypothetical protein